MTEEAVITSVATYGPLVRIVCGWSPYGWAHAYVDNDKGTLMICSDWGDWTYRWGLAGMPEGTAVDRFIFRRTNDRWDWNYVANKLLRGENDEYDHEKTQSYLRKQLAEAFRSTHGRHADSDTKQAYRDAIFVVASSDTFEELEDASDILEFFTVDYTDRQESPSQAYRNLTELILPALAQAWRSAG